MLIRKMEITDCEAVYHLFAECFSKPWSFAAIKDMFAKSDYYNLVAVDDKICPDSGDRILGYSGIIKLLDEADIVNVAVSPASRKQGIATRLMESLLKDSEKMGIHSIYLEVREHNKAAIRLYERSGFKETGMRKNYYTDPSEHAILMAWQSK